MEPTTAKSNNILRITILVLLCIPLAWSIGTKIYYFNLYTNTDFLYWFILRTLISLLFIYMIYKKMYGILLYLISASIFGLVTTLFQWMNYPSIGILDWVFSGLNLIKLVLMIILLSNEHNRFFNLRFTSDPGNYPLTYQRIRNLNILLSLLGLISFISLFTFVSQEPQVYYNGYIILLLLLFIFTIIGMANNSKFQLLSFMISLIFINDVFQSSQALLLMPFTGNPNDGWDQIGMIIGLAFLSFLLTFGTLVFFILHSYIKERRLNNNMNPTDSQILDT